MGEARLRQIDALIEQHVFGHAVEWLDGPNGTRYALTVEAVEPGHGRMWRRNPLVYTESWDAAGQVVEKMAEKGWGMAHINSWPFSSMARGHNVIFYKAVYPPAYTDGGWEEGDMGQSFPLAVALAALRAVGCEVPG